MGQSSGNATNAPKHRLGQELMVALDLVRALAAMIVVIDHLGKSVIPALAPIARFGQEAVIVFFLLSGFVIYANEWHRAHNIRAYALRRVRRIYPLLVLTMVLSTLLFLFQGRLGDSFSWTQLIGNLIGLQDAGALKPGTIVAPYLNNQPLWSLSYELAFYLIFPLVLRWSLRSPSRTDLAVVLFSTCCFLFYISTPNHFALIGAYFLIWWAGAMAARAYLSGGYSLSALRIPLAGLLAIVAIAALNVMAQGMNGIGLYPFLMVRHFLVALVLLGLVALPWVQAISGPIMPMASLASFGSSISYGLYLLHYPILIQSGLSQSMAGFALGLVILIGLAWLLDCKLNQILPKPTGNARRPETPPAQPTTTS